MAAFDPRYYGVPPSQQIQIDSRAPYTASAGQTVFPASYTPGALDVYYNGACLDPRTQFTATNGTSFTLTTPAEAGAIVYGVGRAQVPITNVYTQAQTLALIDNFYANTTGGTANAITATTTPSFSTWNDGMEVKVRMTSANTSTTPTININGTGALTIVRDGQQALTGNDWSALSEVTLRYDATAGNLTIVEGKESVLPATLAAQPVQFSQISGVVGQTRNLKASLITTGTSISYTADEIIVESTLGGLRYCLANFSQTISGTTTGLGGLDTGSLSASSYYAIYAAITSSGTQGIFAQLEPSSGATSIYGGSHLPSNVIATALIGVWPTNSSSQFVIGSQRDRRFSGNSTSYNPLTAESSITALSISAAIPKAAISYRGYALFSNTTANETNELILSENSGAAGTIPLAASTTGGALGFNIATGEIGVSVAQTTYYSTSGAGGPSIGLAITGYTF